MTKIIIGIHGLRNKPPRWLLKYWWKKAIREGLRNIDRIHWIFRFEMVYWAHILHPKSLKPWIRNKDHPLYLNTPYKSGKKTIPQKDHKLRKTMLEVLEKEMDKIFLNDDLSFNFEALTDRILRSHFQDLDSYYSKTIVDKQNRGPAKEIIRDELARTLKKHRRKKILLIGHSMGSIIAYDVLTHSVPAVGIDTLITIGSPLGIPIIIRKIHAEHHEVSLEVKPKTPDNITGAWYNFSDVEDKVALDLTLRNDYGPNCHGVKAVDKLIYNDYEINGERNPHKSYGYLRAREVSEIIDKFISE